jgi:hypothetical protein
LAIAPAAPINNDPARILTGLWQLTDVLAASDPAVTSAGQKGRLIELDRHALSALDGAGCAGPTLQPWTQISSRAFDTDEQVLIQLAGSMAAGGVDGIAGFCLGRLFALYMPAKDGSLLVADATAIYRLQRLGARIP